VKSGPAAWLLALLGQSDSALRVALPAPKRTVASRAHMPRPSSLRGKSHPSVIYLTFHRNCLRIRSRRQRLAGYRRLCEHLGRNWEIKVYRLFTRGRRSALTSKISSPNTSTWLECASQAAIFMGPVGAVLLGNGSRWGFILGLATQPFWFYTSFRHRQWGIFISSILYASGWAIGVYRNF
jgi:hypothetical protein